MALEYVTKYEGSGSKKLKIETGEPIHGVIDKLISAIESLKDAPSNLPAQNISSHEIVHTNTQYLYPEQNSLVAEMFSNKRVGYTIDRSSDLAEVSINIDKDDLPAGYAISASRISISGEKVNGRSQIVNTKTGDATAKIPYNRFPIDVEAVSTINGPTGDIEVRKKITLTGNEGNGSVPMTVIDMTTKSQASNLLGDIVVSMAKRIDKLERKK